MDFSRLRGSPKDHPNGRRNRPAGLQLRALEAAERTLQCCLLALAALSLTAGHRAQALGLDDLFDAAKKKLQDTINGKPAATPVPKPAPAPVPAPPPPVVDRTPVPIPPGGDWDARTLMQTPLSGLHFLFDVPYPALPPKDLPEVSAEDREDVGHWMFRRTEPHSREIRDLYLLATAPELDELATMLAVLHGTASRVRQQTEGTLTPDQEFRWKLAREHDAAWRAIAAAEPASAARVRDLQAHRNYFLVLGAKAARHVPGAVRELTARAHSLAQERTGLPAILLAEDWMGMAQAETSFWPFETLGATDPLLRLINSKTLGEASSIAGAQVQGMETSGCCAWNAPASARIELPRDVLRRVVPGSYAGHFECPGGPALRMTLYQDEAPEQRATATLANPAASPVPNRDAQPGYFKLYGDLRVETIAGRTGSPPFEAQIAGGIDTGTGVLALTGYNWGRADPPSAPSAEKNASPSALDSLWNKVTGKPSQPAPVPVTALPAERKFMLTLMAAGDGRQWRGTVLSAGFDCSVLSLEREKDPDTATLPAVTDADPGLALQLARLPVGLLAQEQPELPLPVSSVMWLEPYSPGVWPQSYPKGFSGEYWLRVGALQGDRDAWIALGRLYENGWGVRQDVKEAQDAYLRAAGLGDLRALAPVEAFRRSGGSPSGQEPVPELLKSEQADANARALAACRSGPVHEAMNRLFAESPQAPGWNQLDFTTFAQFDTDAVTAVAVIGQRMPIRCRAHSRATSATVQYERQSTQFNPSPRNEELARQYNQDAYDRAKSKAETITKGRGYDFYITLVPLEPDWYYAYLPDFPDAHQVIHPAMDRFVPRQAVGLSVAPAAADSGGNSAHSLPRPASASVKEPAAARNSVAMPSGAAEEHRQTGPEAAAEAGLHSVDASRPTSLTIRNPSDRKVDVFWKDYQGKEVHYAQVDPSRELVQPTFATHPWVIRDSESHVIVGIVVADSHPVSFVVPASGGAAVRSIPSFQLAARQQAEIVARIKP